MEEAQLMCETNSVIISVLPVKIGRVMAVLLNAQPRKLMRAISQFQSTRKRVSLGPPDDSLQMFHEYMRNAVKNKEPLDFVLVPIIEHSSRLKNSKHKGTAMILLEWLLQDEFISQAVATNFASVIMAKDDHSIAFGWCILLRGLLERKKEVDKYTQFGTRRNCDDVLKIFCTCIPRLLSIICKGSILQEKNELPTRLAVAAADCILALTEFLVIVKQVHFEPSVHKPSPPSQLVSTVSAESRESASEISKSKEMSSILWNNLDTFMTLLEKLFLWNQRSRPLHARGIKKVLKWLQALKEGFTCSGMEAGCRSLENGIILLSSCWKQYCVLLHLEDECIPRDFKDIFSQLISGIQLFTENSNEKHSSYDESSIDTRKFFFNCLMLLLGRLDETQMETLITDHGVQLLHVLVSQLRSIDDEISDVAAFILKSVIFKAVFCASKTSDSGTMFCQSRTSHTGTMDMDVVLSRLLSLLDEGGGTSKVVVMLVAEYCSICKDGNYLLEVLKRLRYGNLSQRTNLLDVISVLISTSLRSAAEVSNSMWHEMAKHLLLCIEDEESTIVAQSSNLLPSLDPSMVLPTLIRLICSRIERIQSNASSAFILLLRCHSERIDVICLLVDCLSGRLNVNDGWEESKLDVDRVFLLITEWGKCVEDWKPIFEALIVKMFAEPSNVMLVRLLSHIKENLAEVADVALQQIALQTKAQKAEDKNCLKVQGSVFGLLCPLLIVRMLPLKVFDDINSSIIYGQLHNNGAGTGVEYMEQEECIAALLLNRAFLFLEVKDVSKLAAELCGRLAPQVLLPFILHQLRSAATLRNIAEIKACLFSVCTSLAIRGWESFRHPAVYEVTVIAETILLWPSADEEVSKAQHGCIDCLALMVCAELEGLKSSKTSLDAIREGRECIARNSVTARVVERLKSEETIGTSEASSLKSFRICMANVLIRACQKVSDSRKTILARVMFPDIIGSLQVVDDSDVRAACFQVLFSAVHNLKSAVLPYSKDLLAASLESLTAISENEKLGAVRVMTALMASEEVIVEHIAGGLVHARIALSVAASTDSSPAVRQNNIHPAPAILRYRFWGSAAGPLHAASSWNIRVCSVKLGREFGSSHAQGLGEDVCRMSIITNDNRSNKS